MFCRLFVVLFLVAAAVSTVGCSLKIQRDSGATPAVTDASRQLNQSGGANANVAGMWVNAEGSVITIQESSSQLNFIIGGSAYPGSIDGSAVQAFGLTALVNPNATLISFSNGDFFVPYLNGAWINAEGSVLNLQNATGGGLAIAYGSSTYPGQFYNNPSVPLVLSAFGLTAEVGVGGSALAFSNGDYFVPYIAGQWINNEGSVIAISQAANGLVAMAVGQSSYSGQFSVTPGGVTVLQAFGLTATVSPDRSAINFSNGDAFKPYTPPPPQTMTVYAGIAINVGQTVTTDPNLFPSGECPEYSAIQLYLSPIAGSQPVYDCGYTYQGQYGRNLLDNAPIAANAIANGWSLSCGAPIGYLLAAQAPGTVPVYQCPLFWLYAGFNYYTSTPNGSWCQLVGYSPQVSETDSRCL
jgi:hypothetical protein